MGRPRTSRRRRGSVRLIRDDLRSDRDDLRSRLLNYRAGLHTSSCLRQSNNDRLGDMARDMTRLENLLGAQSLALADRLLAGAGGPDDASASECAALVTLLAHPGRTVGWLGGVLGLTSSGVTRLTERLVSAGWVERTPGADARRRELELTSAGKRQAKRVLAGRRAALSSAVAVLSPAEQTHLETLLDTMVARLATDRQEALRVCRLCDRTSCCDAGRDCPLQPTTADG